MPVPPVSEPAPAPHDPYRAFRTPAYRLYSLGNFIAVLGRQMLGLAVGYEMYLRTHSSTALGLIGLAGAIPIIFLALPAGQVADRFDRRKIIIATQFLSALSSLGLVFTSLKAAAFEGNAILTSMAGVFHWLAVLFKEDSSTVTFSGATPVIFALLLVNGIARTFGWAARSPFIANIVPRNSLVSAVTWGSSLFEIGCIVGPALGGFVVGGFGFPLVYALDALASLAFVACLLPISYKQERYAGTTGSIKDLFSGIRFVWNTKVILATITLDLFAVLLGGATALLPIYADQILHIDAFGLGWLRAAQSVGAVTMAMVLAHSKPMKNAGWAMLLAVAGFGAATIVFGLSRSFWISFVALAFVGAFDNISVVVRHTLVQLLTPDSMRGRVAAVNNIFIGTSNEIGMLESGLAASYFGLVLSVVAGGVGTICAVIAIAIKWPEVRKIRGLSDTAADVEAEAAAAADPAGQLDEKET